MRHLVLGKVGGNRTFLSVHRVSLVSESYAMQENRIFNHMLNGGSARSASTDIRYKASRSRRRLRRKLISLGLIYWLVAQ
jgi:hypothetical protein